MDATLPPDDDATRIRVPQRPAAPRDPILPVGTRVEEFEISGLIGQGGFGIVYIAEDQVLHRRVALKEFMPADLAERVDGDAITVKSEDARQTFDIALRSFVNEAKLLASFDHPSLVKVYRYLQANGTAYMVMPYFQGETLTKKLKREGPPDENWLKYYLLRPLLEALDVIHAQQIYHRDIAPDNIVLEAERPVLLDFGAARQLVGDRKQPLTIMYKTGYTPIEQFDESNTLKTGPWTDIYALGAVVYYAIMQRAPMASEVRNVSDSLVPLSQAAAGRYSEAFLGAIDAALRIRPHERPQSVAEFRDLLGIEDLAVGTTNLRLGEGTARRAPVEPASRTAVATPVEAASKPLPIALIAGGAVAALAVAGAAAWFLLAGKEEPPPAPTPPAQVVETAPPVPVQPPAPTVDLSSPQAVLNAVFTARDANRAVTVAVEKPKVRIGADKLTFTLSSARAGYVYVLMAGTQSELLLLFPNDVDTDNRIEAGKEIALPRPGWELEAAGPPGIDQFVVVVTDRPRDITRTGGTKVSPYVDFPPSSLAPVYDWITGAQDCPAGTGACAFGAAAFSIEEIPR